MYMKNKNLYLKTTITTIVTTIVYAIVIYLFRRGFDWESIIFFAIIFWLIFFFCQKRFEKREKIKEIVYRDINKQQKTERKEKILEIFKEKEKITNNDVEKLLGVSDATATNYLQELEDEGKIEQIGRTGRSVFYRLK